MGLVPWNPFRDMDNISREMGNFFDRSPFGFFGKATSPRVDVFETDNDVVLKAEIPGVSKEDLNVYVELKGFMEAFPEQFPCLVKLNPNRQRQNTRMVFSRLKFLKLNQHK